MGERKKYTSVDEYLQDIPEPTQAIFEKIRRLVREIAPEHAEVISYNIPCFKVKGTYLIYFAAYDKHFGLYPLSEKQSAVLPKLQPYLSGKGTAKFMLDEPIPYDLIKDVIKLRLREVLDKTA